MIEKNDFKLEVDVTKILETCMAEIKRSSTNWYLDLDASNHIIIDKNLVTNIVTWPIIQNIIIANGVGFFVAE